MALYVVKYTKTETLTVIVEADTIEDAKNVEGDNYYQGVKTTYLNESSITIDSSDEISLTPHTG